ncbi:MAG: phosphoethanolamine transferase domain-containing protein [Roseateles sp.]
MLLALYQALCLNAPELWERLQSMLTDGAAAAAWITVAAEPGLVLGACLLLTLLVACLGRVALISAGGAMVLLSAAASFYMVRYDVVIGYGIVQAVMASDQALSREKLGHELLLWVLALGVAPLVAWWRLCLRRQGPGPQARRVWGGRLAVFSAALGLTFASHAAVRHQAELHPEGRPAVSVSGMVAHRYVPTN